MKRIATIAVVMAAVAAPAAGSLQAATAKPTSEREVRIVGTIAKLTAVKLKVTNGSRTVAFVIPAGFKGTWETLKPVRKWYVIWQPR